MATSFIDEFKKARSSWLSPTEANKTAKANLQTNNTWTSAAWTPNPPTYVNNPDGTPVNATSPVSTNEVVNYNNIQTWPTTPIENKQTPLTPTADTTNSDIASTNVIEANKNITETASSEKASQIKTTAELGAIDVSQANTKIANAQANIAELTANEKAQQLQKQANEEEYQANLRKNQEEEVSALKLLQSSETDANKAEAAYLKAKNEKAEQEAATANEVAMLQSNVAFSKLWLAFSWAAINTSQKIFTDWVTSLSELKTRNASNLANLNVKINSIAFEHTQAISKLIQDTAEKEFNSKERLREFIGSSQNNILLGKKESQKAIQDAISIYKSESQAREDKLYSDMNSANDRLKSSVEDIQKAVIVEETNWKLQIDAAVNNWRWGTLSPAQQMEMEKKAWLPIGSTASNLIQKVTQLVWDKIKAIAWKDVSVPIAVMNLIQAEIQRAMKLGMSMSLATEQAIAKYKDKIPWVKLAETAEKNKITQAQLKSEAEIAKLKSETEENLAQAWKATAEAWKVRSWGGGWWAKSSKVTTITNQELRDWYYHNILRNKETGEEIKDMWIAKVETDFTWAPKRIEIKKSPKDEGKEFFWNILNFWKSAYNTLTK